MSVDKLFVRTAGNDQHVPSVEFWIKFNNSFYWIYFNYSIRIQILTIKRVDWTWLNFSVSSRYKYTSQVEFRHCINRQSKRFDDFWSEDGKTTVGNGYRLGDGDKLFFRIALVDPHRLCAVLSPGVGQGPSSHLSPDDPVASCRLMLNSTILFWFFLFQVDCFLVGQAKKNKTTTQSRDNDPKWLFVSDWCRTSWTLDWWNKTV